MEKFVNTKPGAKLSAKKAPSTFTQQDEQEEEGSEMEVEIQNVAPARQGTAENLPWVEKYRPHTLDDVISHDQIVNTSA